MRRKIGGDVGIYRGLVLGLFCEERNRWRRWDLQRCGSMAACGSGMDGGGGGVVFGLLLKDCGTFITPLVKVRVILGNMWSNVQLLSLVTPAQITKQAQQNI